MNFFIWIYIQHQMFWLVVYKNANGDIDILWYELFIKTSQEPRELQKADGLDLFVFIKNCNPTTSS